MHTRRLSSSGTTRAAQHKSPDPPRPAHLFSRSIVDASDGTARLRDALPVSRRSPACKAARARDDMAAWRGDPRRVERRCARPQLAPVADSPAPTSDSSDICPKASLRTYRGGYSLDSPSLTFTPRVRNEMPRGARCPPSAPQAAASDWLGLARCWAIGRDSLEQHRAVARPDALGKQALRVSPRMRCQAFRLPGALKNTRDHKPSHSQLLAYRARTR